MVYSLFPLTSSTFSTNFIEFQCGNNSVVECNLAKVEVAGSNPVSRFERNLGWFKDHPFFVGLFRIYSIL